MATRALIPLLALALLAAGCGELPRSSRLPPGVRIVAAESFWGSIAAQLAGTRGSVESIVANPNQDPHAYTPSPADARLLAQSQLVIVNGIGYDAWAPRLLAADPADGREVLTVGSLLGLHDGDNPHRWYDPGDVSTIARTITAELKRRDPAGSAYYDARARSFETHALRDYHRLIAEIHTRYGGVAVGASESIFALLVPSLGLRLLTPPGYMKAVAEGVDVTAQDESQTHDQIDNRRVAVWIYNSQNDTPDVQHLNAEATARRIPVVTMTETPVPTGASFQSWQVAQLLRLEQALHRATAR